MQVLPAQSWFLEHFNLNSQPDYCPSPHGRKSILLAISRKGHQSLASELKQLRSNVYNRIDASAKRCYYAARWTMKRFINDPARGG